jgi:hypothetical protein
MMNMPPTCPTLSAIGHPQRDVAAVLGHAGPSNETEGTYYGGPTDAMKRAVVESVTLPVEVLD